MTLEAMQRVVCLLLTDRAFQARFFDGAVELDEHGLDEREFLALRSINPAKLGIVSEGFVGKRLDALASALPRTWAALKRARPGFVADYLAAAPHAHEGEEGERFVAFVRGLDSTWLADLAGLEQLVHVTPLVQRLPSVPRPDARPRHSEGAPVFEAQGPLDRFLDAQPGHYPAEPCAFLVLRGAAGLRLERLDAEHAALLRLCDGTATWAGLVERFGPSAEAALRRWLAAGVLEA